MPDPSLWTIFLPTFQLILLWASVPCSEGYDRFGVVVLLHDCILHGKNRRLRWLHYRWGKKEKEILVELEPSWRVVKCSMVV